MDKKLVSLEELSNGSSWTTLKYVNTPRQENVTDCGVHVCINMHCLAFDVPLTCSPTNANFFRKKIGCDIVRGAIMMWWIDLLKHKLLPHSFFSKLEESCRMIVVTKLKLIDHHCYLSSLMPMKPSHLLASLTHSNTLCHRLASLWCSVILWFVCSLFDDRWGRCGGLRGGRGLGLRGGFLYRQKGFEVTDLLIASLNNVSNSIPNTVKLTADVHDVLSPPTWNPASFVRRMIREQQIFWFDQYSNSFVQTLDSLGSML